MEMCSGGELFEEIKRQSRMSEQDASKIIRQITEAIKYMHDQVWHTDCFVVHIVIYRPSVFEWYDAFLPRKP